MGMEFYNLTQEELCDLMCGTPEYDDNIYYVTNADIRTNLWEYKFINKDDVYVMTFGQEYYPINCFNYEYDWDEIEEMFALVKIDSIEQLDTLLTSWKYPLIVSEAEPFDKFQIRHIKIYDDYIE